MEERMTSFVAWHGEVPPEATRLDDFQARKLAATGVRGLVPTPAGDGEAIGFALAERWWTVSFVHNEQCDYTTPPGAENWLVEGHDAFGGLWTSNYFYWPQQSRWRHIFYEFFGADYGRAGYLVAVTYR
jgi:hypothetical protein